MAKLGMVSAKKEYFSTIGFMALGMICIFLATKYNFFSKGLCSMLDMGNASVKPFIVVEIILMGITSLYYGFYKIVKEVAYDPEEKNKESSLLIRCYFILILPVVLSHLRFFSGFHISVYPSILRFFILSLPQHGPRW